jgi:hypothetical protein
MMSLEWKIKAQRNRIEQLEARIKELEQQLNTLIRYNETLWQLAQRGDAPASNEADY